MESVFSAAYCVVAATSAVDSNAGFLERDASTEYAYIQNNLGERFYVSTDIDNFDEDVGKAQLNHRAWVMQEAVLARRTIHFSANQTYWECGKGVYCENLTRLERYELRNTDANIFLTGYLILSSLEKTYFTLDPNFPTRLLESSAERAVGFLEFLFENYSKRGLTEKTDRCVAISGLAARISRIIKCEGRYGVFQKYLHRNLLWQASDQKLERIAYRERRVPSWSWMAYAGGVRFVAVPFGRVDWVDGLRFDKDSEHALIANLGRFQGCTMELEGDHCAILDHRKKRGWIRYDVEDGKKLHEERCVVVGRMSGATVYYILVVRPTGVRGEYKRVGVGLVRNNYVVRQRVVARIV